MLSVLAQMFSINDVEEQRRLMRASVELMEASAVVGAALARMPAEANNSGVNAGMTFAVPRNAAYRPLEDRARSLFLERTRQLQAAGRDTLKGEAAQKASRRLQNAAALIEGSAALDK
jgi:hypothetical protein